MIFSKWSGTRLSIRRGHPGIRRTASRLWLTNQMGRVQLQVNRGKLCRFLLLTVQTGQTIRERVGDAELHSVTF